jgi:RecA/RadA recombinase
MGDPGCLQKNQEVLVYVSEKTKVYRRILVEGVDNEESVPQEMLTPEVIENEIGSTELESFMDHVAQKSKLVPIYDIFSSYYDRLVLASTPDGFIPVGDLVIKHEKQVLRIETANGKSAEVSADHHFESPDGSWISASDCLTGTVLLTELGPSEVVSHQILSESETVYDWEILHPNHRYWAGGISSHNTGKSFLCLNIVREAQKKGYNVIYCDTEGAIDKTSALKFGIDANKLRYQPIQTVSQFQTFVANVLDMMKKAKSGGEDPKIMLVVDSLGMLSTDKELADAVKGHNAADMGSKAKELRKLFRVITLDLTAAKVPLIVTNHVYTGGGYMPTKESSGGDGPIFAMSVVSFLSKAQLKDGSGTKTGIIVTSNLKKSRFTIPEPVKFHISFANGMNPYVGLQDFVSWEACGIERGKYEEVKGPDGKKELVFKPSATSTRWGVRHLGKTIASTQLFTPEVFTEEVLRQLDENVIKPHFKLPDVVKDDFLDEIASDEEGED